MKIIEPEYLYDNIKLKNTISSDPGPKPPKARSPRLEAEPPKLPLKSAKRLLGKTPLKMCVK